MSGQWIPVVAGAIYRPDGRWLMHRRPFAKRHGGLWEFPGGKVEPNEIPVHSIIRELREELGIAIAPGDVEPVCFAEEDPAHRENPIVILLYRIAAFTGTPRAIEGESIDWFTPGEIARLDRPPLDIALARGLFGALD